MDLDALRTFAAVARVGGLTQAARELNVSVPAASARIRSLEEEAGFALFTRASTGMRLTPRGQVLLETARELLDQADRLNRTVKSLADGPRTLRLCVVPQADPARLAALSARLVTDRPDLDVSLLTGLSGDVWRLVEEGAVEAGLALDLSATRAFSGLDFLPLAAVSHALVGPTDADPGAGPGDLPFLATPPACSLNAAAARLFAGLGLAVPRPLAVADNEDLLVDMVAQGLGLAVVRQTTALAQAVAGRVRVWPTAPVELALGRVRKAGRPTPELVFLDQVLYDLWPQPANGPSGPANRPSEDKA